MTRKQVVHTLDTLPPLTVKHQQHLDLLATLPDDTIDLTDMPELTDAQLAEMRRPRRKVGRAGAKAGLGRAQ